MHLIDTITGEEPSIVDPRDPEVFAEMVKLHHRDLLVYARALTQEVNTARDIVQDAFIVAYQKRESFDPTRDFPTWMRGIVRNKWREWLRKNRRYEFSDNDLAVTEADLAAWQAQHVSDNHTVFEALELCLKRLPENLRDTVYAYYYEGRSGEEVSQALGVAPAAVRKRLQRARTLLKECVDEKLDLVSPS